MHLRNESGPVTLQRGATRATNLKKDTNPHIKHNEAHTGAYSAEDFEDRNSSFWDFFFNLLGVFKKKKS